MGGIIRNNQMQDTLLKRTTQAILGSALMITPWVLLAQSSNSKNIGEHIISRVNIAFMFISFFAGGTIKQKNRPISPPCNLNRLNFPIKIAPGA